MRIGITLEKRDLQSIGGHKVRKILNLRYCAMKGLTHLVLETVQNIPKNLCYVEAAVGARQNSMGLGTVIDISTTPVNSEQLIMRSIKNDYDNETAGMSSDRITKLCDHLHYFWAIVSPVKGKRGQVHSINGIDTVLAAEQPSEDQCFDSSNCPHDPEPSTSKEGLVSRKTGNEQKIKY
ncbi:hypothetical protein DINM_002341 [Dirofilaria immitis]|nr:hypothetical protein [Dirofilaria immitis]